jgi:hypothetical protein
MLNAKHTIGALATAAALATPVAASARTFEMPQYPPAHAVPTHSVVKTAAVTSSGGFQWDDAGIGAAAMLALLGAGGSVTLAARRRRTMPAA